RSCTPKRAKVYYECMEPFKSLMRLWVRNKNIAAIWLEKVVTPLIEPAVKGFAAASAVLKPKRIKVDKHGRLRGRSIPVLEDHRSILRVTTPYNSINIGQDNSFRMNLRETMMNMYREIVENVKKN
nr:hypothetical protein [Tanacetum cinerariifolium]